MSPQMAATSLQHNSPLLGLDWGMKRIGVAFSPDGAHSFPRRTLTYATEREALEAIKALVQEEKVLTIVLGLPVTMQGAESEMADRVRAFGQLLTKESDITLVYEDERLSSTFAHAKQQEGSTRDADSLAALTILENYLAKR